MRITLILDNVEFNTTCFGPGDIVHIGDVRVTEFVNAGT